jgi:hypothetical protein
MPHTIILHAGNRQYAARVLAQAPDGYRVHISEPKRSVEQSDKMWAMLGEFSKQATLHGQKYDKEDWKLIFLHALGRELRMAPALDGKGFVPIGTSSSRLSVKDMSDLIELIYAEGAARGVVFKDPTMEGTDYDSR